jgi:hypothetical protein
MNQRELNTDFSRPLPYQKSYFGDVPVGLFVPEQYIELARGLELNFLQNETELGYQSRIKPIISKLKQEFSKNSQQSVLFFLLYQIDGEFRIVQRKAIRQKLIKSYSDRVKEAIIDRYDYFYLRTLPDANLDPQAVSTKIYRLWEERKDSIVGLVCIDFNVIDGHLPDALKVMDEMLESTLGSEAYKTYKSYQRDSFRTNNTIDLSKVKDLRFLMGLVGQRYSLYGQRIDGAPISPKADLAFKFHQRWLDVLKQEATRRGVYRKGH